MSDAMDHPSPSLAELVVKLGPETQIMVDTDPDGYPILAIVDGVLTLLLMQLGAAEGGPVTKHDVLQGSELLLAVAAYRDALNDTYAREQGEPSMTSGRRGGRIGTTEAE